MNNTSLTTMQENLTKLEAKEIYYFRWQSDEPYTVMAGDGKKYGQLITVGYTDNEEHIKALDLPMYNQCPIN